MENYNAIEEQIKALMEQICDKLSPNGTTFTQQLFVVDALRKMAHTTKMQMVKHMTTTFNV